MDEKATMLERLRALREKTDKALGGVTNEQMTTPVQMRTGPSRDVRYIFYQLLIHEAEHTVQLAKTLDMLGAVPTEAQYILRQLQEHRGQLEGLLLQVSDADMEREPRAGEWSVRQVLEHILSGEESYTRRITDPLAAARQGEGGASRTG
ncbi:MAG: DinB family protein [Chloroflexi bacterium]|nr:DinB family protein [Chloroflexota bacterium]